MSLQQSAIAQGAHTERQHAPRDVLEIAATPRGARTEATRALALEALSKGASLAAAADAAGIDRATLWRWRDEDEQFAADCAEAIHAGTDYLEDEAHRRAMGWTEPVYDHKGNLTGERFTASDRLMEFMLAGRRPEKFRQPRGGDVTINNQQVNNTLNAIMSPEVSALLEAVALTKGGGFSRGEGEK